MVDNLLGTGITLKKFLGSQNYDEFVNYYCYGVNVIEFSIRMKNRKHSYGIEIRIRGSFIIPMMIAENMA